MSDEIKFSSGSAPFAAVSKIGVYKMVADPVDRAGNVITPSNKVYVDGDIDGENPWANWGHNNLLCDDLAQKIRKTGVLKSGIGAKARIAIGKGRKPVLITDLDPKTGEEVYEFFYDDEIENWFDLVDDFDNSIRNIRNRIGYGWTHTRIYLDNAGEKIAYYKTDDVVKCRIGKADKTTGKSEYTYYSPNWNKYLTTKESIDYKRIPLLEEGNELADLIQRLEDNPDLKEFSIISRDDMDGQNYYPDPLWFSVYDWVELAIRVPEMKKAMFNNQMSIKYMVYINEAYFKRSDIKWGKYTAPEQKAIFDGKIAEINKHMSGNDNAYKSIGTRFYIDPATGNEVKDIRIDVLDDKVKDGKLLPDSSAANKEILFSLMMNPAIMGANTIGGAEGGAGSGSDIREAYLVQIMLMEAERHMNNKVLKIVKRFNGWDKKYEGKNLQFRYPNLILTTLDKGGSTAPVNT